MVRICRCLEHIHKPSRCCSTPPHPANVCSAIMSPAALSQLQGRPSRHDPLCRHPANHTIATVSPRSTRCAVCGQPVGVWPPGNKKSPPSQPKTVPSSCPAYQTVPRACCPPPCIKTMLTRPHHHQALPYTSTPCPVLQHSNPNPPPYISNVSHHAVPRGCCPPPCIKKMGSPGEVPSIMSIAASR